MYRNTVYLFCEINLHIKFIGETYQMATTTLMSAMIPIIPPTTAPHELPGCFAPAERKTLSLSASFQLDLMHFANVAYHCHVPS